MNIALLSSRYRPFVSPTKLQSKDGGYGTGTTSATSAAVGYASNTTAGSLLVLVAWAQGGSGSTASVGISSVTTAGFTWTLAASQTFLGSSGHLAGAVAIYYIANASSMATSTHTTVSATGGAGNASTEVEFSLYEFGPLNGTLDTTQTGSGSSSAPSTTNFTTAYKDLIVVAYCASGSSPCTAGSGYTLGVTAGTITECGGQYNLVANAGTVATAFVGSQTAWAAAAAAFKI